MYRTLQPVQLDFVDRAPIVHTLNMELHAPAERVYEMLCDSPATWTWMPSVRGGRWLSSEHGVGGRRQILVGPAKITETVLAADPGRRWAYRVDTTSVPLANALVEDWVLTEEPATSTRPAFTSVAYSFCFAASPTTAPAIKAIGLPLSRIGAKVARNLNRIFAAEA